MKKTLKKTNLFKNPLNLRVAILFVALSFVSVARAEEKLHGDLVLCQLSSAVRSLRIQGTAQSGCETIYTKAGKDQKIGESQTKDICETVLSKVRVNLEKAGWNCRTVSNAALFKVSE